jgi:hypothetical protein
MHCSNSQVPSCFTTLSCILNSSPPEIFWPLVSSNHEKHHQVQLKKNTSCQVAHEFDEV